MAEAGGGRGSLTCEYLWLTGRVGAGTDRRGQGCGHCSPFRAVRAEFGAFNAAKVAFTA
ncbi:hypothetical protein [Kibdelosporangium philippinense]|uniref:hypothetical protein n=1 Tax=Kibdelosporangium philippinense TaxID=211113 RepID=UPI0036163606